MKSIISTISIITLVILTSTQAFTQPPALPKKAPTESEKIQLLISAISALENAQFYRNGSYHDAKAAAAHLRLKLNKAGNSIKTANDFILKLATKSSMTGEAYKIRYSNGKIIEAKNFLIEKLKEIERK